jgi:hypothetical protein
MKKPAHRHRWLLRGTVSGQGAAALQTSLTKARRLMTDVSIS